MLFVGKADDYSNPGYLGSKFRKKRFAFFEEKLQQLEKPVAILDLGGTVNFWLNEDYQGKKSIQITVLNLRKEGEDHSNIKMVQGDACDLSRFGDNSFDVVFSNSLIEHLYTKENQVKMAREAMRVGRHYFIQTPNKYFPIEPHFKFPFFQFLPNVAKTFLLTKTCIINGNKYPREYAENILKEIRMLSKKEFRALFPGSRLYVEKFMGMEKSFIVHDFS